MPCCPFVRRWLGSMPWIWFLFSHRIHLKAERTGCAPIWHRPWPTFIPVLSVSPADVWLTEMVWTIFMIGKALIGALEERKPLRNLWGYHQTRGLGYHEYFLFCEDMGAEPVPVVAAGVPCQNSGTCSHHSVANWVVAVSKAESRWRKCRSTCRMYWT